MKDYTFKRRENTTDFTSKNILEQRDKQYPSKNAKEEITEIPSIPNELIKEINLIEKVYSLNPKKQSLQPMNNEIEVCVPLFHPKRSFRVDLLYAFMNNEIEVCVPSNGFDLLYALNSGVAFTIKNGNIYIWYKPWKGFENSGFYRMKRFGFIDDGELLVKFFLDENEKLEL